MIPSPRSVPYRSVSGFPFSSTIRVVERRWSLEGTTTEASASAVTSKSSANQPGSWKAASVAYRSRSATVVPAYGVRLTQS
jgi:hypothetical protein